MFEDIGDLPRNVPRQFRKPIPKTVSIKGLLVTWCLSCIPEWGHCEMKSPTIRTTEKFTFLRRDKHIFRTYRISDNAFNPGWALYKVPMRLGVF